MLDERTQAYLEDMQNLHLANDISQLYTALGEDATDLTAPHLQELTDATDGVKTMTSVLGKLYDAYKETEAKLKAAKETNIQLMYQISQAGIDKPVNKEEADEKEAQQTDDELDAALDALEVED